MTLWLDNNVFIKREPQTVFKKSNLFYIGRGGVPEHSIMGGIAEINIWNRPLNSQQLEQLREYYLNTHESTHGRYAFFQKVFWIIGWTGLASLIVLFLLDHGKKTINFSLLIIMKPLKQFYTGNREQLLILAKELDVDVKGKTNFEIKQELIKTINPYIEISTISEGQIDAMLDERLV